MASVSELGSHESDRARQLRLGAGRAEIEPALDECKSRQVACAVAQPVEDCSSHIGPPWFEDVIDHEQALFAEGAFYEQEICSHVGVGMAPVDVDPLALGRKRNVELMRVRFEEAVLVAVIARQLRLDFGEDVVVDDVDKCRLIADSRSRVDQLKCSRSTLDTNLQKWSPYTALFLPGK